MSSSENMVCIELGYDFKIILPVERGQELLRLLSQAEMYSEKYNSEARTHHIIVKPMDKQINMRFISRTAYDVGKLAFLRSDDDTD